MKNFFFPQIFQPVIGHLVDGVKSSNPGSTYRFKTERNMPEIVSRESLGIDDMPSNRKIGIKSAARIKT